MIDKNDKKNQIIEAALQLFASRGFYATSIQDIAEEVGIAKGSVYLHFKSKEDLLISALKHTMHRMIEEVAQVASAPGLTPKERLVRKLAKQLRFGYEHKSFFIMVMNEGMIHVNDDLKTFMLDLRVRSYRWTLQDVIDVYGERIGAYAADAVVILQALTGHYTGILILDQADVDTDELALFLADRLDDVVQGMLDKGRPPMLTECMLFGPASAAGAEEVVGEQSRIDMRAHWLRMLRETILESVPDEAKRTELHSYAVVLEHELKKPAPSPAVLEGLLSHLRAAEPPALGALTLQLEKELNRAPRQI